MTDPTSSDRSEPSDGNEDFPEVRQAAEAHAAAMLAERGLDSAADTLADLREAAQTLIARHQDAHPADRPLACAPGCLWCCLLRGVHLSVLEALVLDAAVEALPPPTRTRVRAAALAEAPTTGALPCPLLDEAGLCSAHDARPMVCRRQNAFDAEECRAADSTGRAPTVTGYLPQHAVWTAFLRGLLRAETRAGMPGPLSLHRALASMTRLRTAGGDPARDLSWIAEALATRDPPAD